jgi:hypothetical protein
VDISPRYNLSTLRQSVCTTSTNDLTVQKLTSHNLLLHMPSKSTQSLKKKVILKARGRSIYLSTFDCQIFGVGSEGT